MTTPIITQKEIENSIYTVRGVQVMLDSDLAKIYQVETKLSTRLSKGIKTGFRNLFALS